MHINVRHRIQLNRTNHIVIKYWSSWLSKYHTLISEYLLFRSPGLSEVYLLLHLKCLSKGFISSGIKETLFPSIHSWGCCYIPAEWKHSCEFNCHRLWFLLNNDLVLSESGVLPSRFLDTQVISLGIYWCIMWTFQCSIFQQLYRLDTMAAHDLD